MPRETAAPRRRELTPDLFDRLLTRFSSNRLEAGEQYNVIRARLIQYFAWQGVDGAADLADEVVNRVARRLAEGEDIPNLRGYFLGVARLVTLEARQRRAREGQVHEEFSRRTGAADATRQDEQALECLDRCLSQLTGTRRSQLLAYYTSDDGSRIAARQQLAKTLGIDMGALRNRMLRGRQQLEACVEHCVDERDHRDGHRDGSARPVTEDRRSRVGHGDDPT